MKLKQIWQDAKVWIIFGAIAGAIFMAILGVRAFRTNWGLLGVVPGAILGAIAGLDSLLVRPKKIGSGLRTSPPFTSGAMLTAVSLVCLGFGLYAWGSIFFICVRQASGQVDCRRVAYNWLGLVKDNEQPYEQIHRVTQASPEQVLMATATHEHALLEGFGPDAADRINHFIDSQEQTLVLENKSLWFSSPLFFGIGGVMLILAIISFGWGLIKLSEQLGD